MQNLTPRRSKLGDFSKHHVNMSLSQPYGHSTDYILMHYHHQKIFIIIHPLSQLIRLNSIYYAVVVCLVYNCLCVMWQCDRFSDDWGWCWCDVLGSWDRDREVLAIVNHQVLSILQIFCPVLIIQHLPPPVNW